MAFERVRSAAEAAWGSGLLRPVRPDRAVRMLGPYRRFGPVPATVGALSALRFPDRTAVIDEDGTLSFAELDRGAAALATALRDRLAGDPGGVGLLCRNHRGFLLALLAASRLGNDVVLLNTDFSAAQLGEVLDREGAALLVHDEEFTETVAASAFAGHRVPTGEAAELAEATEPEPVRADRPSRVIVLTSGTTGTPKGARHSLTIGAMTSAMLTHLGRVPMRSGEPVVLGPPLFHVLGMGYATLGLGLGSPLVLARRFDAAGALAAVERHRAGVLVAVPLMLRRMLDLPRPAEPSLRAVICGGSALSPALSEAFMDAYGEVLYNVYGATETGWTAIAAPADLRAAPGTVGRPAVGITVKILDAQGNALPAGETGEIFVGGGIEFAGYTGGGGRPLRDGLSGTGDLGHLDGEGRLFVDGRTDDMIVSGGENVFPGEVEDLLEGHPGIAEVVVSGVRDAEFGQRLVAHVVRSPGSGLTGDEVKRHVKDRLARYKAPRDVFFVDELPRTATGKVKRRDLPA